jgi:hypothetical protein
MFYVWVAGVLGFFVFDCYRVRSAYGRNKKMALVTLSSVEGVLVHCGVYVAAGILAVFVNLDTIERCCNWEWLPNLNQNIIGPLARGFGIGIAGPAGISRGKVPADQSGSVDRAFDDLSSTSTKWRALIAYLRILLMR